MSPTNKKAPTAQGSSALSRALAQVRKITDEDPVVPLTMDQSSKSMPHIPTGSLVIDYLIGGEPNKMGIPPCPGIPRSRITNLYGNPGTGKTTLALTLAASVCAMGGSVAYIDWENEVEPRYAQVLGVPIGDINKFVILQPDSLEEGVQIMYALAQEGVDLIVIDSVGAAVPKKKREQTLEEKGNVTRPGMIAAAWSDTIPEFKQAISKTHTAVLAISQLRKSLNMAGYGPDHTVQGGEAWKFYSSIRMMLKVVSKEKGKKLNPLSGKVEDVVVGTVVKAILEKCKVSDHAFLAYDFFLSNGQGIDNTRSVVDMAISYKIIKQAGSWYTWESGPGGEPVKSAGLEGLLKTIREKPENLKLLFDQVRPKLSSVTQEITPEMMSGEATDDLIDELDSAQADAAKA